MKKAILFFVLLFFSLMFLIFQKWNWLYVDTSYSANTLSRNIEYIHWSLSTISFDTYFGFDNTLLHSTRFLQWFFNFFWQRVVYILFFVFSFLSSYFLLKQKFSKDNSFYWALIYTFNPVTFYFISQVGFVFSYFSLPLVFLSIYKFFTEWKYRFLLLSIFGFYAMLSYTRLIWIYWATLVIFWIYYFDFIKKIFLNKKKQLFVYIISHILVFSPFIFGFLYPYFNWDKEYFSWLWNYSMANMSFWESIYSVILNDNFYNWFIPSEILWNSVRSFQSTDIFIIFSIVFIIWVTLYSLFLNKRNKDKLVLLFICFFLFLVFFRLLAKFIPSGLFVSITYTYFPFVANNLNWLYVLYVSIIAYLFVFCLESVKTKIWKNILIWSGVIYLFISIYPFANFWWNYKLQTIDIKNIPQNYQNTFFAEKIEKNPVVFVPSWSLYMNWTPYVFEFWNNSIYKHIFTNNFRYVSQKQIALFQTWENLRNNAIFNMKDIFVFKDIKNPKEWQFDFYESKNYISMSNAYYMTLRNNKDFYLKQDNKNFAQFWIKGDSQYDFLLYSPSEIIEAEIPELLYKNLDYKLNPILIDKESFHKTKKIDDFYIPRENKKVQISYKKSVLQPTKIYTKIQNIGSKKWFLIQLNQTFWMSWKIKWITKEEFEEKNCINNNRNFVFTNNSFCEYKASILDLSDLKYLFRKWVKEQNHFEWNFVWNAWLVEEDDISSESKDKKELYAVIIYEKQIWYDLILLIALLTFLSLSFLSVYQEIKDFKNTKNEK